MLDKINITLTKNEEGIYEGFVIQDGIAFVISSPIETLGETIQQIVETPYGIMNEIGES